MMLDSSGLLAYVDDGDPAHEDAVAFFAAADVLLIHSYILAELIPLFQTRGVPRRRSLELQSKLLGSSEVRMSWVDGRLHETTLTLLNDRMDKTYSLADAVSFVLMRSAGITDALSTDRHFEQEGFVRLLKP